MSFPLIFLKTARKIAPREAADLSSTRFTPRSLCMEPLAAAGTSYLTAPFKSDSFAPGQRQLLDLGASLALQLRRARPANPQHSELFCPCLREGELAAAPLPAPPGVGLAVHPCPSKPLRSPGDAGTAGQRSVIWGVGGGRQQLRHLLNVHPRTAACVRLRQCLRLPVRARQLSAARRLLAPLRTSPP